MILILMVVRNSVMKMPTGRHCPRVDTLELRLQIERKLGQQKAEKYFSLLSQYFSRKLKKLEFDKLCIGLVGRENICLHNGLIRAIIKNACLAKTPPPKQSKTDGSLSVKVPNGYQRNGLQALCRDVFPQSPRKGRTPSLRERSKFRDRPSPLGPYGKTHNVASEDLIPKVQEQQSATELLSLGSRPPAEVNSVEEGEEVEQAAGSPSIYSRSPVRAPLGISINTKATRKVLSSGSAPFYTTTCHNSGELLDTSSLRNKLEQKLDMEGLKISMDCVNLLNNGLDVYMKRLIKPCLELAGSRSEHKNLIHLHNRATSGLNGTRPVRYVQKPNIVFYASMLDFRVAVESNPRILGEDWPVQLEKVCLRASEEPIGTD